jgi:hypothetical protein
MHTALEATPTGCPPEPVTRLDWTRLSDAFELSCLVQATSVAPVGGARSTRPRLAADTGTSIEFNQEAAARRMAQLLHRLGLPYRQEVAVAGLRRRYQLHRMSVPGPRQAEYAALTAMAWWQGRAALLRTAAVGTTAPAHQWRLRLAGAAWRGVLLTAGRHVRKHILGVRVIDQDLAAVLVRSAQLFDAPATLSRQTGCLLVSVPGGVAAGRVLAGAGATEGPLL